MADDRQSDDLSRRIHAAQDAQRRPITSAEGAAESRGWAIGIEFVGVVLVSAAIGWGIDNYTTLGSRPWGLVGMLVLGFVAGVYRAQKTTAQFDADAGNDRK